MFKSLTDADVFVLQSREMCPALSLESRQTWEIKNKLTVQLKVLFTVTFQQKRSLIEGKPFISWKYWSLTESLMAISLLSALALAL